jgi:hypothetical protein
MFLCEKGDLVMKITKVASIFSPIAVFIAFFAVLSVPARAAPPNGSGSLSGQVSSERRVLKD